jgi:hypothetical protein
MDPDTSASKRKTTVVLLSVSVFVLTLLLFSPARIYIGNFKEFTALFNQSVLFFLAVSLVLTAALFTAILFLSRSKRACRTIVSILLAAAFLMWVQGNLIPWRYGVLNGSDIEWNKLIYYGIADSLLWTVVMAFGIWKANLVFRFSRLASLVLIVIQLLSVFQVWLSMPKDQSFRQQEDTTDSLFLFSKHVNVIIMVLDTFQSDIFQEIVQEDADLRASFDGFTYFRNSLAGSNGTTVSVPNMLTASNYDNSMPYLEFVKKTFLENSLPKTLKEYSFDIDLFPLFSYSVYSDFSGMPLPQTRLMDLGAFLKEQALIADLSLFRSAPHFLKELIYNHQKWFLSGLIARRQEAQEAKRSARGGESGASATRVPKYAKEFQNSKKMVGKNRDAGFIQRMIPLSGILESRDAFKFYHLHGLHLPLDINENLGYQARTPTRDAIKRQATGVLKIAAIFLERLKQMEVYDNSLIFIVGDHGSGAATRINPSPYGDQLNRNGPYKGSFRGFKSAGIPLILAKRMKAKGPLRTSDAPVALGDMPQTVVEELGLNAKFPGESMFRVKEGEDRERIYRAFFGSQEDVEYLAPLYEYSVKGFSWDDTSWRETGNVYYAKVK